MGYEGCGVVVYAMMRFSRFRGGAGWAVGEESGRSREACEVWMGLRGVMIAHAVSEGVSYTSGLQRGTGREVASLHHRLLMTLDRRRFRGGEYSFVLVLWYEVDCRSACR